jgi:hypothetical protein
MFLPKSSCKYMRIGKLIFPEPTLKRREKPYLLGLTLGMTGGKK